MKKLILLIVLTTFACSSGDDSSNDNSNNILFLEKYDGVVWEEIGNSPDDRFGHIFYNSPETVVTYEFWDGQIQCYSMEIGSDGTSIITHSEDVLVVEEVDEDENGVIETYTITITATNNGQGLTLEFSDDPTDPEFYERINNNPCN